MEKNRINLVGDIAQPCPCGTCIKKGCGAYHNDCKNYLGWKEEVDANKRIKSILKDISY